MSGVLTIYRRELAGLFLGPLAWVLLCVALVLAGAQFVSDLSNSGGDITYSIGAAAANGAILLVLPPLLTMRMISEESRSGILEFLLTSPVTDLAVVLGKLLAATTFMVVLWSSVIVFGLTVQTLGATPDWAVVLGAFVGASLISTLFCAIGLLASASTQTPILAAFLALVFNLLILFVPEFARMAGAQPENWLGAVSRQANIVARVQRSFTMGVVDTADVVFFLGWTAFFVFLATRMLESRRWR